MAFVSSLIHLCYKYLFKRWLRLTWPYFRQLGFVKVGQGCIYSWLEIHTTIAHLDVHLFLLESTSCHSTILSSQRDLSLTFHSTRSSSAVVSLSQPTLDKDELSNYRPISNLSLLSKIIECVVKTRLSDQPYMKQPP